MTSKKILFIGGSLNQTTMMHHIARRLPGYECYFTPFYADGLIDLAARLGLLRYTILGELHQRSTRHYLAQNALPVDERGEKYAYDLVVTSTDLIMQRNIRNTRVLLVQEGITEPENLGYFLAHYLRLPRFVANTAALGQSGLYDAFCVASPGYRDHFIRAGVKPEKIFVTGLPNFDDLERLQCNDFPKHGYVLAASSPLRESLRLDRRLDWIRAARRIAGSRELIFKLHPAENHRRAIREIRQHAPDALVYVGGDTHAMVANCETLITQTSTLTFVGLALGKEVYTRLDLEQVRRLLPVQNGGRSAGKIAGICQALVNTPLEELHSVQGYARLRSRLAKLEAT